MLKKQVELPSIAEDQFQIENQTEDNHFHLFYYPKNFKFRVIGIYLV